jgi:hypothetical protein
MFKRILFLLTLIRIFIFLYRRKDNEGFRKTLLLALLMATVLLSIPAYIAKE